MKKITLSNRRLTYAILLCLLIGISCKKDLISKPEPPTIPKQLISSEKIEKWLQSNPAAQLLKLDWSKAQQAVVDGKAVVRIPTLSSEKKINIGTELSKTGLKNGSGKIQSIATNGTNVHYYAEHPPEVFFIQNSDENIHAYLLNFIPDDPLQEFGKDGLWTGKLYEWNLTGDTIFTQHIEKNKLIEQFAVRPKQQLAKQSGNISNLRDHQTSSFFGDIWDALGEFVGWVGSLFGLSEHVWDPYDYEMEWRLNINFDWLTGPGDGSYSYGSNYVAAGYPIYNSYMPGYNPENYASSVYQPYPNNNGGPTMIEDLNPAGNYIIDHIALTPNEADFLLANEGEAVAIKAFLDANQLSENSKEYAKLALSYLMETPGMTFNSLYEFITENDEDLDQTIKTDPSTFVSIPDQITLNNGQIVKLTFGVTPSDHKSAKQKVHPKLVEALKTALNMASNHVIISSIFISASTNGGHKDKSNHFSGIALDISQIDGVRMIISGNNAKISALQDALESLPDIRENFGPSFIHKNKKPAVVAGHKDHIHFSINP